MLYFIPWAILIVAVIIAVPVVAKMSPGGRVAKSDDGAEEMVESTEGEDDGQVVLDDDFGGGDAEAFQDDAFEELK